MEQDRAGAREMDTEREVKAGGRDGVASEEGEKGREKVGCGLGVWLSW